MFKTLYAKLIFWFFIILVVITAIYIGLTAVTVPMYQQEVTQKLHENLAKNLVKESLLLNESKINQQALEHVFHNLMVVNPAIEVYLTDVDGKILSYSAPPGKVKKTFINLKPVNAFINHQTNLPILGDNPRDHKGQKVFSAAKVINNDIHEGYLYIVLGGEEYDSVVNMLQGSYILQLSATTMITGFVITLLVGFFIFNLITRRLRYLSNIMEKFKKSDFQHNIELPERFDGRQVDEVDQIGTTFREMSERIILLVNQLKATDASRRELVANVSHDLRTPLSSLQGYLETLTLKSSELSDEEKQEYLRIAFKQSERLGRLISELFELAMLENQNAPIHYEPFSLAELAQDVSQKFILLAKEKNIKLITQLPADSPFVSADIALIERVLENLIENAIKYTPSGGEVNLCISQKSNQLMTIIKDTGLGIADNDLPHIFERFYRVDKSRQSEQEGTGLGLAISKRILQLHDSVINVKSEFEKGTEFSFSLPEHIPA